MGCSSSSDKNFQALAKQSLEQQFNGKIEQAERTEVTQLTDLVNIPELNKLIQQSMHHNPGLQQTLMALKIVYAHRSATNG